MLGRKVCGNWVVPSSDSGGSVRAGAVLGRVRGARRPPLGGGVDLTYPLIPAPPASVLGSLRKHQASGEAAAVCVAHLVGE